MTRASMSQAPTILVVDDSEVVLTVTKSLLEASGYRVLTHSGPAGCVAVILQEKPDLLLIDVNMPKLGGETIVKLFGKAQPNSETIILLFSTLPADQLEQRARLSGAHGFIRKTEDTFELVRQVNRWLRKDLSGNLKRSSSAEVPAIALPPTSGTRSKASKSVPPPARNQQPDTDETRSSGKIRLLPVVLFLDDDMAALSAFRRHVQGEPYRADFALSAAHALRHLDAKEPPDLIVARLEPSGVDIYERARARDATWKNRFVFVVGPTRSARAASLLETFHGPVLHHPLEAEQLRRALRQLLSVTVPTNQRTLGG